MDYRGGAIQKGALQIKVPQDITVVRPAARIPSGIAAFFGKTGVWYGRWKSPQVKGGYEALLIVREIKNLSEAEIVYVVPDYPEWYVSALQWESPATFTTRSDGKFVLRIPYSPAATTIDFWMKENKMQGIMYGRYMRCDITMNPFAS